MIHTKQPQDILAMIHKKQAQEISTFMATFPLTSSCPLACREESLSTLVSSSPLSDKVKLCFFHQKVSKISSVGVCHNFYHIAKLSKKATLKFINPPY